MGSYTSSLSKLSPYTKYSVRAYAINSAGIGYGDILMFSSEAETINDYDGNIYHVIPIGNQKWLAENLSTTHFQNGNSITHRRVSNTSIYDSSACYWDYDDNFISNPPYGRFYSLLAITDNRNICPPGYHVPSEDEWTTLLYFLGGESVAGGKMKATGTIEDKTGYWHTPNTGATNESGFSAIPAGGAGVNGLNQFISDMRGTDCNWWSAKTVRLHGYIFGYTWFVNLNDTRLLHYGSQGYNIATGLSVRCIKDSK